MTDEPTKGVIFLGVVDLSDGEKTLAFDIPLDADADTIKAAIAAAEAEKAAAQVAESKWLREMFLKPEADEKGEPHE
jgi:hypothetical protein